MGNGEFVFGRCGSLGELLTNAAGRQGDKPAVIFAGGATSYNELEALSNRIANQLAADGIVKGDRVVLYCINSHWFAAAYFGVIKTGATVVPVNLLLSAEEIVYILTDSGAAGLLYYGGLEKNLAGSGEAFGRLRSFIVLGEKSTLGARQIGDVVKNNAPDFSVPELDMEDDVAAILYTSGTTGRPKGAMLTHCNILCNVDSILRTLPIHESDVFLTVLPMFHAFGATTCLITPLAAGGTIAAVPRFTPDETAHAIKSAGATIFMGVPSMYALYANLPHDVRDALSTLRFCISGGAALPQDVMERFEKRYGVLIYEGDGPTECSPVTAVNPVGGVRKPCSIGLPVRDVSMKIVDNDGRELPSGDIGEIVVKGPNVMKGYYQREQETRESFFGAWFRTGDLGYVDADGYFYIVDRKKDMIIVNGMNVYPRVVEEVLYRHPAVAEAAVVGDPHPLHGEIPRAVIALKPGMSADKHEIVQFCKLHLGRHEIPRVVEFLPELPKTPTGKISKRALIRKTDREY